MLRSILNRKDRGFTMIELLLVVAIIGMLAALLLGYMEDSRESARDSNRKQQLRSMQTVLEFYRNETGSYPATSNDWRYSCDSTTDYIPNLVADGYASQLPLESDRCVTGSYAGYWYSSTGDEFKLIYFDPHDLPATGETFFDGDRPGPNLPAALAVCSDDALCFNEDAFPGFSVSDSDFTD